MSVGPQTYTIIHFLVFSRGAGAQGLRICNTGKRGELGSVSKVDLCEDLLILTLKSTSIMNTAGSISGSDPSGRDGFSVIHGCYEVTLRKR